MIRPKAARKVLTIADARQTFAAKRLSKLTWQKVAFVGATSVAAKAAIDRYLHARERRLSSAEAAPLPSLDLGAPEHSDEGLVAMLRREDLTLGEKTAHLRSALGQLAVDGGQRVALEVHKTEDMARLLARSLQGQTLEGHERDRVRSQVVDLLKLVPAAAVFVVPGGGFLLAGLEKTLPFSLLPSSFSKERTVVEEEVAHHRAEKEAHRGWFKQGLTSTVERLKQLTDRRAAAQPPSASENGGADAQD